MLDNKNKDMLDDKLFLEDENNLEDEITLENEMLKELTNGKEDNGNE